ncbi:MAG TPA: cobalamin-independent methionine synthase II family protein [Acetobacteraceae bacterium]|jgi:5-methyltetrahydropteroyltriglutamate--homocysteine methyltransferase|nr:cobalamin-independent methionine synthase II family protein [Acetobacteraceae bacterium]
MLTSQDRILTTHTGSLPRPAELTALYVQRSRGEPVDPAELDRVGKAAVHDVVAKQVASGVDVGNNGEQQREAFFLYVRHRMSGFGGGWARRVFADVAHYPAFSAWKAAHDAVNESISNTGGVPEAVGEVRYLDRALVEAECRDFRVALDAAKGGFAEPFMTAPSPGIIAAAMRNAWYNTEDAYLDALGKALQVEYETIVAHGFLLQIDAPDLAMERHLSYQDRPLGDFVDFVERVVATINRALENVPRDRVRLHACWGNYEGPHDCDVALPEILPAIRTAKVGGFVLPFANPRHAHEYRCLTSLPLDDDQTIVAGVIDPLTNFVEHPEVVADRIEAVARTVGDPRRVLAGTDCGFDTSAGRGRVADDVVWAKLAALSEGARIASHRLF